MKMSILRASRSLKSCVWQLGIAAGIFSIVIFGHYQRFKKEGIWHQPVAIFFDFFFFTILVITLLRLIDREPLVMISDEGIWLRRNRFPFSRLDFSPWDDISGYWHEIRVFRGSVSDVLKVAVKSSDKQYRVDLTALGSESGEILQVFGAFARLNKIKDLGSESYT